MRRDVHLIVGALLALSAMPSLCVAAETAAVSPSPRDAGYRGIWFTLGQPSTYGDKYSGGLGTYTSNHVPMAIYAPAARKTFFVYGGAKDGKRHLLEMISYYDHDRGIVPRPVIVHDKQGVDDPHDNPSLAIDDRGYLWVFISGRQRFRPGFIYRSAEPYSIDRFELVHEGEFTYPQPRWIDGEGFVFLFTKYTKGRELYASRSPDGSHWDADDKFAAMGGHYQTSELIGRRIITAFNMHPGGNVDRRTNLYFLQTDDFGRTWRNVQGEAIRVPLSNPVNAALVRNYQQEERLIYIHDLGLDAAGRPVILYITSGDCRPGPGGDPRWWTVAHWLGDRWDFREITRANHNYSTGSLYLEANGDSDGTWRIIGPTEPGPQPLGAGGEIAVWASPDSGRTWTKAQELTRNSPMNHNYVRRPVNAQPDFCAFWSDGNPNTLSESRIYFATKSGDVFRLPYTMAEETARPERVTSEAR